MATKFIQKAIKKSGALRATAKRLGFIKGDQPLTRSILERLRARARRTDNTLLLRRVNLALTLGKLRR